jgi:hypothetical protein
MPMSETTASDLSALHIEENRQELALLLQPLIQQAVRDAMPPDMGQVVTELRQARDELQQARDEIQEVKSKYLTAEQAEQSWQRYADKVADPLKTRLDQHLTDLNKEDERRHQAYIQRIAGAEQKAQQSEQRAVEVEKRTAALEATSEQRLKTLESKVERIDRDIENNVKKVADNAEAMNRTFLKFLGEYEKLAGENKQDIQKLKKDQVEADSRFDRVESGIRAAVDLATDVDRLAGKNFQTLNYAIVGNKELKTDGLVDQMKNLAKEQAELKAGLWWQTWIGRNPKKAFALSGAAFVGLVISVAFILGRPEVIAAFVQAVR